MIATMVAAVMTIVTIVSWSSGHNAAHAAHKGVIRWRYALVPALVALAAMITLSVIAGALR